MVAIKPFIGLSIRTKLTLLLFFVALCPLLILNWMSFLAAEDALKKSTLSGLYQSAEYKAGQVYLYLETLKTNTRDFSSDGYIKNALEVMNDEPSVLNSLTEHLLNNKLTTQSDLLYIDVFDINGNIVASTKQERIGIAEFDQSYYRQGIKGMYVSSVSHDSSGQLVGSIAMPLTKIGNPLSTIGVLVNHYRMDKLKELFSGDLVFELSGNTRYNKLSKAESVYLADFNGKLVTSSSIEEASHTQQVLDIYPIEQAQQFNKETNTIWQNNDGDSVAGVSIIIRVDDFEYLLVAEKKLTEAFSHIQHLKAQSYMLLFSTIVVIFFISTLMAYFITRPLNNMMSCIDVINTGHFDIDIKSIKSGDELELLAMKFYDMTQNIKVMRDDLIDKNAKLYELSIRDEMTGLYNHRHLIERGEYCVAEANRYKKPLSFVMVDIDHFKPINDNFGHPFGDIVLSGIAELLRGQLRSCDIISRYGGEEFAILMPSTNIVDATAVAEKLRTKVASHSFEHNGDKHQLTISVGLAEYYHDEDSMMKIIARADKALYRSKENGRNRVSVASSMIELTDCSQATA